MAKSKRKKSTTRILIYIFIAAVVLILVGAASFFLYFDFFKVTRIEVPESLFYERSQFLDQVENKISAQNKFLSVLGPDNIIFWEFSDKSDIAKDPSLPYLSDLNIESDFWERSIALNTKEKNLRGTLCSSACYAFDEKGVIYARAPQLTGNLIFKITESNDRKYVLGRQFLPEKSWPGRIFESIDTLESSGFSITQTSIDSLELREWSVILDSGVELRFSFNFVPDELGRVLTNLSDTVDFGSISYIDLSVPGRVYYQ